LRNVLLFFLLISIPLIGAVMDNNENIPKIILSSPSSTPNYVYWDVENNFTETNYFMELIFFYGGLNLGYTADTTGGNIRYLNNQFQGYNGSDWIILSGGNGTADTTCEDGVCNLSNSYDFPFRNLSFEGTTGFDDLVDNDTTYSDLSEFNDDLGHVEDNTSWDQPTADGLYLPHTVDTSSYINCTGDETFLGNGSCLNTSTLGGGGGTNESIFFNKTATTMTANLSVAGLTGYEAGNYICNSNFTGTHLCDWNEVVRTYDLKNISLLPDWTGTAYVKGGPSKYTGVGVLFVNDGHGFTDDTGTDSFCNAWSFTDDKGLTGACSSVIPLACCKAW